MATKKVKFIYYIFLAVVFASLIRFSFFKFIGKLDFSDLPKASEGVVDLRGVDFSQNKTLKLDGQWQLYPSIFLGEYNKKEAEFSYVKIPGDWYKELDYFKKDEFSYASYRLNIFLDREQGPLALKLDNINEAYKLFANGKLLAEMGQVSSDPLAHRALRMPKIVELKDYDDNIEIIIQISSSSGKGGIIKPIRFGSSRAIHNRSSLIIGLQLLTASVFILHCLYSLTLYFLQVKNRGLIYFALLMLLAAASILVADDRILLSLIKPSYWWHNRLVFLFFNMTSMLIPLVAYFLLDKNSRVRPIYIFALASLTYTSFILFANPNLLLRYSWLLSIFMALSALLTLSMIFIAMKRKENLFFLLLAAIFLSINIFWVIIQARLSLDMVHYPFDLIFALLAFTTFWLHRYSENLRRIQSLAEREVAWLQSQIQPHFIFNTLNSIAALSLSDLPKMQALIERFSDFLRLSFDFKNSDLTVDITHELELVKSYLYIEEARFGSRLNVVWDLDEVLNFSLPPLTIQPLVENAIKHGILARNQGGSVKISIRKAEGFYMVSIEDDGVGFADKTDSSRQGTGLKNIDKRLVQLYGEGLDIESKEGRGSKVSFKIRVSKVPFS